MFERRRGEQRIAVVIERQRCPATHNRKIDGQDAALERGQQLAIDPVAPRLARRLALFRGPRGAILQLDERERRQEHRLARCALRPSGERRAFTIGSEDWKTVVTGKSVEVRVDRGGILLIKKKKQKKFYKTL